MKLPPSEVAILEAASSSDDRPVERIAEEADVPVEVAMGAAFSLEEQGLVTITETVEETVELTEEGRRYVEEGLPEVRLHTAAIEAGADTEAVELGTIIGESDLDDHEIDIALTNYSRVGLGEIDRGALTAVDEPETTEFAALRAIEAGERFEEPAVIDGLERRNLITRRTETRRSIRLTEAGVTAMMSGVEEVESVGRVRPSMLTSGRWRDVEFGAYNVEAGGSPTIGGKEHILRQTANRVKDVLIGMGFREMAGPHVDAQFWINDCLFMPQDHPARTHWDQFALDQPDEIESLPDDLLERVRTAHLEGVGADGEGYHSPWTESLARRLDLRGHTTSLSMRYLSGTAIGDLEPPERFFSVEKVYRNDTLDPTHLLEFFQIEGWVMAEDLSVRDLMGTFTEFYSQFGITNLQFKPHYNPYTEPSFELFGHHPETGELMEIGNSGMFRPEVLEPLEVDCEVMAWGLALERLLMLIYGFEDIRDVHGTLCDIQLLRDTEVLY